MRPPQTFKSEHDAAIRAIRQRTICTDGSLRTEKRGGFSPSMGQVLRVIRLMDPSPMTHPLDSTVPLRRTYVALNPKHLRYDIIATVGKRKPAYARIWRSRGGGW